MVLGILTPFVYGAVIAYILTPVCNKIERLLGKLLDSAIVGVICFDGTSLMRFESAVLISVIVGITNIIPFFGPFIGAIPCAVLLLLEYPNQGGNYHGIY